jgi:Protein of unknown function (DUF3168)
VALTLRAAIYQRLHNDADLAALLGTPGAIYHQVAPAAGVAPYIVFAKQTGNPSWTFGTGRGDHLQQERWLVKAVCSGGSAGPAEQAAERVDDLLHDAPLLLDNARLLYCRRVSDVDYPETSGASVFHHVGAIYRIDTDPS